jgi:circadian clock protein KaiC
MEKLFDTRRIKQGIKKSRTGIKGLDEVLEGGLPEGRPTLICGGPGCGKTLLASEFLIRGVLEYDEPGVFMTFEETPQDLVENVASLGVDLNALVDQKKVFIDYVHIDKSEIEETGEYDLEGLFVRLASAIAIVGAKRVVLDTIESLFAGFSNEGVLRSELRRLFHWLKDRGVTTIVTGERGVETLTRHGLEEYVSDCVILLDNRVREGGATRRLRVVKYRGSSHGSDEYPFLIDQNGIWVLPVTSVGLKYPVSNDLISSGVPGIDKMLESSGFYRGSSILITGAAGTGKTSLAAHLVNETCRRGQRCLFFIYEESPDQVIRNMKSIGIDLQQWVEKGLLSFQAVRPSFYSMEMHLLMSQKRTEEFDPDLVVMDPINTFSLSATSMEMKSLLVRLVDFYKMRQITALFTDLDKGQRDGISADASLASLMDAWIVLKDIESKGEHIRTIEVIKVRGQATSNQVREFRLTNQGAKLVDIYVGESGILTGSAKIAQEANERMEGLKRHQEMENKRRELERKRQALKAQIKALQDEFQFQEEELERVIAEEAEHEQTLLKNQEKVIRARQTLVNSRNKPDELQREDPNERR